MEVYISINGVLRNLIQKFDYHYQNEFIDADIIVDEDKEPFEYKVTGKVQNDNLLKYYAFESVEEYNNFLFIDYTLEIFGHAGLSESNVLVDLNKTIHENPKVNFTLVGLDELGRAKSSTLFFLSKSSFLADNVKFIKSDQIKKAWRQCDVWVTDDKKIIDKCPWNKKAVKYNTQYNEYFTHKYEVKNLKECLKYWEKTTTSMLMRLSQNVAQKLVKKQKKKTTEMMVINNSN